MSASLLKKSECILLIFLLFLFCIIYFGIGFLTTSLYFYLAGSKIGGFPFYFFVTTSPIFIVMFLCISFAEYIAISSKECCGKTLIQNKLPISSFLFTTATLPIWLNLATKILLFFNETRISKILFDYRYNSILYVFCLLFLYFLIPKNKKA